ncbi:MAG: DNA methylase [Bacteroidales bacterium]|nr:DNA methylase [Bacteroidales bacterium]
MRSYIAIDLKSFYASVECVERGLDPLTTNLVVADLSRTEKTICLAVSPSLKAYGIPGRPRLFEVNEKLRSVNAERRRAAPYRRFTGKSADDLALKAHPELEVDYITATPRMSHYIRTSTRIYGIYLKYIAPEDIHVYSIDEVFIDATAYLDTYKMSAHELAMKMIRDVLEQTGITATAGIGTNMYLCKIAMDIVAKHMTPDRDGVRIAELDEMSYRRLLWDHEPITDFWRVGHGIAARLAGMGIRTMGDIARMSLDSEEYLYKQFGINAELLIDHAWGWEPCTMEYIKAYKPEFSSISNGQVLTEPYSFERCRVVVKEMADALALQLVDRGMVSSQFVLWIGYDTASLSDPAIRKRYKGAVSKDWYGRPVPAHVHGTANLKRAVSSSRLITEAVMKVYDEQVGKELLIRRISLTANHMVSEIEARKKAPLQLDLFTDYEAQKKEEEEREEKLGREHVLQETVLEIKRKYGKNSILKGINFEDGATARVRNAQIGGHKE